MSVKLAESEEQAVTGGIWRKLKSRGKVKNFEMALKELTDGELRIFKIMEFRINNLYTN